MSRRQLCLHIGTGKTGTSALQTFFSQNRKLLKRHGIIYPFCGGDRIDNHYLAWSLLKEEGQEQIYPANLRTCAEEWDYVLSQLDGKRNLISSELLGGLSFNAVAQIKEYVSDFDVKVIIYLRRYDSWLDSFYNQKVKGIGICSLPEQEQQNDEIKIWSTVFSKESIVVRPYERGQFLQGTIFADFLHYAFGCAWDKEFVLPPSSINTHLHRIVMEYKRMVNHLPFSPQERQAMPVPILRDLSKRFYDLGQKDVSVFSPQQRLKMIEDHASEYAEIAREYLRREDGRLFYEPLPDPDEDWQSYDVLTEEDARYINRYLAEHHPDVLAVIRQGILAAQSSEDADVKKAAVLLSPGISLGGDLEREQTKGRITMYKQLYLHLGTHKTGTTALQQFFQLNRSVLRQKGIEFPENADGQAGHHRLGWSLHKEAGRPSKLYPGDLKSSQEEWAALLGSGSNTILFSSETLYNLNLKNLNRIKQYAPDFQIKCVIYLRRQDTMTNSIYNQITKTSDLKWTDYDKAPYKMECIDCLDNMSAVFGRENIIVRPYEKQQFYGGTIFADFLHHVFGMELTDEFKIPEGDVNSRLHGIMLEYKRLVNSLALSPDQKSSTLGPLLELSYRFFQEGRPDHLLLSPKKRLEIIQQYMPMNERIARDYLGRGDGRLFYDPLPDPQEAWQPYARLAREDAQLINHYLRERYPAALYTIIEGIMNSLSCEDSAMREAAKQLLPGIAEPFEHNTRLRAALECERKDLGASCKGDRFMQWLRRHLPERIKKPARAVVRKFRLPLGQKEAR